MIFLLLWQHHRGIVSEEILQAQEFDMFQTAVPLPHFYPGDCILFPATMHTQKNRNWKAKKADD